MEVHSHPPLPRHARAVDHRRRKAEVDWPPRSLRTQDRRGYRRLLHPRQPKVKAACRESTVVNSDLLKCLANGSLELTEDFEDDELPPYASWSTEHGYEATFANIDAGRAQGKGDWKKVDFCARQADRDELQDFWVLTCCVDKTHNAMLSFAITTMFRWYEMSAKCYV